MGEGLWCLGVVRGARDLCWGSGAGQGGEGAALPVGGRECLGSRRMRVPGEGEGVQSAAGVHPGA